MGAATGWASLWCWRLLACGAQPLASAAASRTARLVTPATSAPGLALPERASLSWLGPSAAQRRAEQRKESVAGTCFRPSSCAPASCPPWQSGRGAAPALSIRDDLERRFGLKMDSGRAIGSLPIAVRAKISPYACLCLANGEGSERAAWLAGNFQCQPTLFSGPNCTSSASALIILAKRAPVSLRGARQVRVSP